jgi:hypothetical protein
MENILNRLTRGNFINQRFNYNKRRILSTVKTHNFKPNHCLKHTIIISLTLFALNNHNNNGVDNEVDEGNKDVIPSSSNNSSNSSIGGLFPSVRRSLQSTRLQNSSASIKSEDSDNSKGDVTLFEKEDDLEIIEGFSNEKENEETEVLSEEIKEKLNKLKRYEVKFPGEKF